LINEDLKRKIAETRSKHEFLTFLILKDPGGWKCGVVQNVNNRFITIYDLAKINSKKQQSEFLAYADRWWWESGMSLPIDCYIGRNFDVFQYALSTLPKKTLAEDPIGPTYSITEHYLKRVKKRRIDLIDRRS